MAKLARFELDAVIETIVEQIKESKKDSPEQVEYRELCLLRTKVEEEIKEERKSLREEMCERYQKRYPNLEFHVDTYGSMICVSHINKPEYYVDNKTIERELIVSNIKGDVDETIKKIVDKYTK